MKRKKEEEIEISNELETANNQNYKDEEEVKTIKKQVRKKRKERMIIWNVSEVKGKKDNFWKFIKKFEVIGLTET